MRHLEAHHQPALVLLDSSAHLVQMSHRPLTVSQEIFVPRGNTVQKVQVKVLFHLQFFNVWCRLLSESTNHISKFAESSICQIGAVLY